MLSNATDFKSRTLTGRIATGIVVINQDPLYLGRIKVRINELHPQTLDDENLPWVESWSFLSNANSQGNIRIPDIGTKCRILFPSDDLYSGVYITSLPNISNELLEDYPNSYGMIDRSGNLLLINTNKDTCTFYHVSGTNLNIDGAGRTKIQIANYVNTNDDASISNNAGLDIEIIGDLNIKATRDINLQGKNLNINMDNSINVNSNSLTSNNNSLITFNTNSAFTVSAGAMLNLNTAGVANVIGSSGNFGGSGSTFDGHLVQNFQTDVTHTPFFAFSPTGVPPTPSVTSVITNPLTPITQPTPRKRQAYKE